MGLDWDMAEITNDAGNRFTYTHEGDELHVFRVPAGTVIHVVTDQGEDFQQVSAILVTDELAPALLAAISRMAKAEVPA